MTALEVGPPPTMQSSQQTYVLNIRGFCDRLRGSVQFQTSIALRYINGESGVRGCVRRCNGRNRSQQPSIPLWLRSFLLTVEGDRTCANVAGFLDFRPWRAKDGRVLGFVALNGIFLCQLTQVLRQSFWYPPSDHPFGYLQKDVRAMYQRVRSK